MTESPKFHKNIQINLSKVCIPCVEANGKSAEYRSSLMTISFLHTASGSHLCLLSGALLFLHILPGLHPCLSLQTAAYFSPNPTLYLLVKSIHPKSPFSSNDLCTERVKLATLANWSTTER